MSRIFIRGYCDEPSVAPGETQRFYVSTDSECRYEAQLVRLLHGDPDPRGPGFREIEIPSPLDGTHAGRPQRTQAGGFVEIPDPQGRLAGQGGLTVHAYVWPTLPERHQAIASRWNEAQQRGWALTLEDGYPVFTIADGQGRRACVRGERRLFAEVWYSLAAGFDPASGRLFVSQQLKMNRVNSRLGPVVPLDADGSASATGAFAPPAADAPVLLAGLTAEIADGRAWVCRQFNGKIDSPKLYAGLADAAALHADGRAADARLIAHWDFSAEITRRGVPSDAITDVSGGGFAGRCVNQPDRGMTGWNWDGLEEHFVHCPEQYGAMWFHEDSLDDCRWDKSLTLPIPSDLPSGAYALKLEQAGDTDRVPFFVVPPKGTATARIALVMPTFSYMAYANSQVLLNAATGQSVMGVLTTLDDTDLELNASPEFGMSTYDYHRDGRGCAYSSWRRPILNLRPDYRHEFGSVWQFPADLHLVDWLTAKGFAFDIITDHDLHAEGAALLRRYAVVISPSHAEYSSSQMLDAYEQYFASGGRGMYLGANGFYWITSQHPQKPWLIEVRKGESGDQAWRARPGELYHSTTGERGGIWRHRARAPQKIWGTGYTAHGLDVSTGYHQMPDARDPRVAWILAGVGPDEVIGDFGLVNGGAAGLEMDRVDYSLGSPPNTMLIAASHGHTASAMLVPEDQYFAYPGITGRDNPLVRADLAYVTTRNGGAVFSASSMAWCGSLSWNGYANNVSRVTENVLRRFAADGPLEEVV